MVTTTDLAEFGWREKRMAAELLLASCDHGLPDDFYDESVSVMFNVNSGYVFLTNSEYQVAMMNGDKLESWYYLPYSGEEGFKDDFAGRNAEEFEQDDVDYLKEIGVVLH